MRRTTGVALAVALSVGLLAAGAAFGLTDAQVARGAAVFEQSCSTCHGPNGNDGFATPLKGPGSLVRFASTRELYAYTSATMPLAAEGSLTQRQYLDVIAWLLVQRGQPTGAAELTLATLDVTPLQPGSMTMPTASPRTHGFADGRTNARRNANSGGHGRAGARPSVGHGALDTRSAERIQRARPTAGAQRAGPAHDD